MEVLGQGGFGIVYKVRDAHGRTLALKLHTSFRRNSPDILMRFAREVDIASTLRHPNIVRTVGWGTYSQFPYTVMDYVDGPTLREVIDTRNVARPEAWRQLVVQLATPLFRALQYLHAHRIVHRDVKPENIFITEQNVPLLGDFGLSLEQTAGARRSEPGSAVGTLGYMAPEVIKGLEFDRRSDIFSLGIMLIEMFAGRLPYPSRDYGPVMMTLMSTGPARLSTLMEGVPPDLDILLARMTSLQPEERPFTVGAAYAEWVPSVAGFGAVGNEEPSRQPQTSPGDLLMPAFVGRQREMAALTDALNHTSRFGFCVLRGEPGMGRSRLLAEWVRRVQNRAVVRETSARAPYQVPYGPFLRLFRDNALDLAAEAIDPLQQLTPLVQDQVPPPPWEGLEETSRGPTLRLYMEIARALHELAHETDAILVVDDAGGLDPASLDLLSCLPGLLQSLARPTDRGGRWLVVLSLAYEPPGLSRVLSAAPTTEVTLAPFSADELVEVARSAMGVPLAAVPQELISAVRETERNPFLLLESLKALIHAGVLTVGGWGWTWQGEAYRQLQQKLGSVLAEGPFQRLAHYWLKNIRDEDRAVLEACAVGGTELSLAELQAVLGGQQGTILASLDRLGELNLVTAASRSSSTRYSFLSRELQHALVEALPERRRLALFGAWSDAVRTTASFSAIFRGAFYTRGAATMDATALMQAGEAALQALACEQAWQLFLSAEERGVSMSMPQAVRNADVAAQAGHLDVALERIKTLFHVAMVVDEERLLVGRALARIYLRDGRCGEALETWLTLLQHAGLTPSRNLRGALDGNALRKPEYAADLAEVARAAIVYGWLMGRVDLLPTAAFLATALRQLAQRLERDDLAAFAMAADTWLGYRQTGARPAGLDRAEATVHRLPAGPVQRRALADLALLCASVGDLARSYALSQRGESLSRSNGDMTALCQHLDVAGTVLTRWGRLPEAQRKLEEALWLCWMLQLRRHGFSVRTRLATVLLLRGEREEARALLDRPSPYQSDTPMDENQYAEVDAWMRFESGYGADACRDLLACLGRRRELKPGAELMLPLMVRVGMALGDCLRDGTIPEAAGLANLRELAQEASAMAPDTPPALLLAAELAAVQGELASAVRHYEHCLGIPPEVLHDPERALACQRCGLWARYYGQPGWEPWVGQAADLWEEMQAPARARTVRTPPALI